jgi:hypothetical protein
VRRIEPQTSKQCFSPWALRIFVFFDAIPDRLVFVSRYTFRQWAEQIWELEKILKAQGITIPTRSPFEEAALTLIQWDEVRAGRTQHDNKVDHRDLWRRALSLADFAEKIILVRDHADFKQLLPHLELFAKTFDLSQFSATPPENQHNNKLFELYTAAMGLHVMTHCEVDNPNCSDGKNPDVLGEYSGKRWAIACKAMHSRSAKTFAERVSEGVEQIERSPAVRGIVLVNMKNTIDHNVMWPGWRDKNGDWYYRAFTSIDAARAPIIREFEELHVNLVTEHGTEPEFYRQLFAGKKAATCIGLVYSTATGYSEPSGPVFTMLKTIQGLYGPVRDSEAEGLLEKLNNGLHNSPNLPPVLAQEL